MLRRIQELDERFAGASRTSEQTSLIRALAVVLAHSGDSWFWLVGLGLLWWRGPEEWKQLALVMIIGIVITAVVVMVIKFTVRRSRPQGEWGQIYRSTDPHSFPSGHAARSTMLAVIGVGLGPLWLGLALLIWAPLVGLARIILGVHYPSDILAGMLLGLIIGVLVVLFV
ncbi:MAG: phosphatase PAP2 family protein [Chloroflexota bacterium]|nr:MAG: phosphatase PAP2 family protein [Chloroflexota bacterium]